METIEGNILIAKFMQIYDENKSGEKYTTGDALKYHTSWDWLMPVIKKTHDICSEKGEPLSNNSREQDHLEDPVDNPLHWKSWSYHRISLSADINHMWKAVVDFILWYNTTLNK